MAHKNMKKIKKNPKLLKVCRKVLESAIHIKKSASFLTRPGRNVFR